MKEHITDIVGITNHYLRFIQKVLQKCTLSQRSAAPPWPSPYWRIVLLYSVHFRSNVIDDIKMVQQGTARLVTGRYQQREHNPEDFGASLGMTKPV